MASKGDRSKRINCEIELGKIYLVLTLTKLAGFFFSPEATFHDSQIVLVYRPLMHRRRRLYLPKLKFSHTYLSTLGCVILNILYNIPSWIQQTRQDIPPGSAIASFAFHNIFPATVFVSWRQRMSFSIVSVELMAGNWNLKEIEWKDFLCVIGKIK